MVKYLMQKQVNISNSALYSTDIFVTGSADDGLLYGNRIEGIQLHELIIFRYCIYLMQFFE
jgi:hypothetical protein